jgi:hypothetical protein
MKYVMFAQLIYTINVLGFTAVSAVLPFVQDHLGNKGPMASRRSPMPSRRRTAITGRPLRG